MKRINTREELVQLAKELGTRPDWHEPDEQELWVEVRGNNFDNAGFWPEAQACKDKEGNITVMEMCVFINKGTKENYDRVAVINLASLLAWASSGMYHSDAFQSLLNTWRKHQAVCQTPQAGL